mgnify:CR=1 FL=1
MTVLTSFIHSLSRQGRTTMIIRHSKKTIHLVMAVLTAIGFFGLVISNDSGSVSANKVDQTGAKARTVNVYDRNSTTIIHVMNKNISAKVKAPNQSSAQSSKSNMSSKGSQVKNKKPSSKQTPTSSTPAVSSTATNSSITPAKVKRERNNYVNGQLGRPPLTPTDDSTQSSNGKIVSQAAKSLPGLSTIISAVVIIAVAGIFVGRSKRFHVFSE